MVSKCLLTTVSRGLLGQCGQVEFNRQLLAVSRHYVDNMGYCFLGVHITHTKGKGKSIGQNIGCKRGSSGQVDNSVLSRHNSTSHYTYLYTIQLHRIRYI